MEKKLSGKIVAIVVTDGFELSELEKPKQVLEDNGATVHIISPKTGKVKSWDKSNWGKEFTVDKTVHDVSHADYHALVLPGGVMNPDKLRMDDDVVDFIRGFVNTGKPISAICHGPWPLIEAGGVSGRTMTSYPSLKTDLRNAGANWVNEEVVVDNGLVTSRNPDDLPAFTKKMVEEIAEGKHEKENSF